jgi:hypothetical protein
MKAYWDIVQGTEEWHRIRYGKIGGTTSNQLRIESDALLNEIISSKLEDFELEEDGFISSDMQRGNELEPLARREAKSYTGLDFKECGWLQCEENKLLGISPDGITKDFKFATEIKCPARKKHTETLRGKAIPADHLPQCVHNFTVNPFLEILYFVSFRPESKHPLFVKEMTRDTLVDFGTKAKPNVMPVSQWVKFIKGKALLLEANVIRELQILDSI